MSKRRKGKRPIKKTTKGAQARNQHVEWRTFNIDMPEVLIPIYDHLQQELDRILTDENLMRQIMQVNTNLKRGDYWRELRDIIGDGFKQWGYGSNAWYARMIYEQLRRIVTSGEERRAVHDALLRHNNEITDKLWEDLNESGIRPKHGVVRNVQREIRNGSFTACPMSATLVMDYTSVSDAAIEKKLADNRWLFRTSATSWLDIEILLPKNVRKQATGKIAKPRFMKKRLTGEYTGCVSYEVLIPDELSPDRVLGVDLGIVKPFSASALGADGLVSSEYVISKRTQHLIDKYDRIQQSIDRLFAKQSRCEGLVTGERFERRAAEIEAACRKRRRLRSEIVRFVALDIVLCALAEDCGEVHVERLSWLDSTGGSWNHSEVQAALAEVASLFGLRVLKVNAAYSSCTDPVSGEHGVERGRDVVFEGWVVDRDFLASVNLACRPVGDEDECRFVDGSLRLRKARNPKRVRRPSRSRECLGDVSVPHVVVDYDKILNSSSSRFPSGGVDVVALSMGRGGLPPARSIKVMANTGNKVRHAASSTEKTT